MKNTINTLLALFTLTTFAFAQQPEPPVAPSSIDGSSVSEVRLIWDASPDHDKVSHYTIHWGAGDSSYPSAVDVGTNITATITNLQVGSTYHFVASAMGTNGIRSEFSNEYVHFLSDETSNPETNRISSLSMVAVILEGKEEGSDSYEIITNWNFALFTLKTNATVRARVTVTNQEVVTWE